MIDHITDYQDPPLDPTDKPPWLEDIERSVSRCISDLDHRPHSRSIDSGDIEAEIIGYTIDGEDEYLLAGVKIPLYLDVRQGQERSVAEQLRRLASWIERELKLVK